MGEREDDARAPTLAVSPAPPDRSSRPLIASLKAGDRISRYKLVARLGAGAMGVVWSAHDPQLDRMVAIKLVHPTLARSPEATERLLREARAMAKVSARAVVTVHDAGDDHGQVFVAMEYVEGTNLGVMLRARPPDDVSDWQRWLALMLEAGRGLAAAHGADVLHRDFKPDNVLVDESGRVCVGDFGLATLGEETLAAASSTRLQADTPLDLTTTGALVGTPAYMSPQQLRGQPIDARADQFSFCVATWEAVLGVRPFPIEATGLDAIPELLERLERDRPMRPAGSAVPVEIVEILERGLSVDPDARWPDMRALLSGLAAALRRDRKASPRRRGLLAAAAVALVAGIVAIVVLVRRDGATREAVVPSDAPPQRAAPSGVVADRLFGVPMRTSIAISRDGKRLALGSNRLEVRALDGPDTWSTSLPQGTDLLHLEVDDQEVRFGIGGAISRWRYRDGSPTTTGAPMEGRWVGTTTLGEAVLTANPATIAIVGPTPQRWPVSVDLEVMEVSPDRTKIAYFENTRFTGRLLIRDVTTQRTINGPVLEAPTAIAWLDDQHVAVAVGTVATPTVLRFELADGELRGPVTLYSTEAGWFGSLVGRDRTLYLVQMKPTTRARVVERAKDRSAAYDLDNATGGAALGWTLADQFLAWNRDTHRVDRRTPRDVQLTKVVLDGEPANATIAGDTLIVALRGNAGRVVVAVSLTTGEALWRHNDHKTVAVRCADDRHAPCYAIRSDDARDSLVTLDPSTGELGTTSLYTGRFEDVAINADGSHLLVGTASPRILELAPDGAQSRVHTTPFTHVRSVAFDPLGGILIGGTVGRNRYQVGRLSDAGFELLNQADDDILSLVRPSADGSRVLVLVRAFAPEVWRARLPNP